MNYFSSDFTLGILGGGQLGKMLLYETRKYDIRTFVLSPDLDTPCRISCNKFVIGDLMDYNDVYSFGKEVNILTLETEHVNVLALEQLENEGVIVYPSSKTLGIIQDKSQQKQFYVDCNITTAPFRYYSKRPEIKDIPFKMPFVWKLTNFGYDGYGVSVIKNEKDFHDLGKESCIIEQLIPFSHEISVIVARSTNGQTKAYPPVEMQFHPEANQVEYVICPSKLEEGMKKKVIDIALQVSKKIQHVGLLAVEMFITKEEDVLVNEIAPRPHNSGHFSIEGSYTNQFEQHLRAILGLPLGKTSSKIPAVMINLVGEEGHIGKPYYQNIDKIMQLEGVTPHIYGKRETKPFRKMGHITVVNFDIRKAKDIAKDIKQQIKVISQ